MLLEAEKKIITSDQSPPEDGYHNPVLDVSTTVFIMMIISCNNLQSKF